MNNHGPDMDSPTEGTEQEQPADGIAGGNKAYTLPGLDGQWTLEQLVEMELQKDRRLGQVRRRVLPPEFWDARRRALNRIRLQRNYRRRRLHGEALRQQEVEQLACMDEQQLAEHQAQSDAQRAAAKAAAAAQRQLVAEAMDHGLQIVVDCSLSGTASHREVRSLAKQLELCAAANKRACRPVSLQFAGFTGAIERFAVESMHADRWPAARSHQAPLQQLYPLACDLVILSPDAAQPLLSLDPPKIYVIGGLVDRTVQKGASLKLAECCGAQAVRLPLMEHLGPLPNGKGVLNVNDVFLILLALHGGETWSTALNRAVPQRFREQRQTPVMHND